MGLPILKNPCSHGSLTRYVKLRIAHAPGMLRTFSPPPQVSYLNMPWCMPVLLMSSFLWSRWRGNVPGIHGGPLRIRILQVYVSGKRPIKGWYSLDRCSFWNQHHQCPYIWNNSKPFIVSRPSSLSWKRRFFSRNIFIWLPLVYIVLWQIGVRNTVVIHSQLNMTLFMGLIKFRYTQ